MSARVPNANSTIDDSGVPVRAVRAPVRNRGRKAAPADPAPQRSAAAPRRGWKLDRGDVAALATLVGMAFYLVLPLWWHLDHELYNDPQDQAFFEWMMAHGARVVTDLVNPFVSERMNAPTGVNMMANTSVLAVSLPMTPITLLFGPHVAFNTFLTLALTATGISWYLLLSRIFLTSRVAAWIGALFATFAPSMVSHAAGHPNIVSQFLVPVIIWRTLRLRESGRAVRNGLLLAAVIVWQAFINLEVLFMTAVGLGIFTAMMIALRREHRREVLPFVRGLGVAALAALVALAYPLYVQFFGPYSYTGLPPSVRGFGADLASYVAYARQSIAGTPSGAGPLAQNASEENAFFGWPLVVLFFALVGWLRHRAQVLALATVALIFAAMSLGPVIHLNGRSTGVPSPWALLRNLPILHSAVPTRWALAIAPVIAILLALGVQRALQIARERPVAGRPVRITIATVLTAALLPLFPEPLVMRPMAPVPEFVTSGAWREYVDENHSVVSVPMAESSYPDPLRWSAFTGHDMRIARGYFLGPVEYGPNPRYRFAVFTAPWRSTSSYFSALKAEKYVDPVDNTRRRIALSDLRYWQAAVVVLAPQPRDYELRTAMSQILGFQPVWTRGVWLWDVRHLVDNPAATLSRPE